MADYKTRVYVQNELNSRDKKIYFERIFDRSSLDVDFVSIIKGLLECYEHGFSVNLNIAKL